MKFRKAANALALCCLAILELGCPSPASAAGASGAPVPEGNVPGFDLQFTDDFSGGINTGKWWYVNGAIGGGYGVWNSSHAYVQNNVLVLSTYNDGGQPTSGAIMLQTMSQTYGKYLVRWKMDPGASAAGSALLWPQNQQWPPEIDLFEAFDGTRQTFFSTLHWADPNATYQLIPPNPADWSGQRYNGTDNYLILPQQADATQWHTSGVEWTPDQVTYTHDGDLVETVRLTPAQDLSHQAMYLSLQTQPQQNSGNINTPVNMYIDWVAQYSYDPSTYPASVTVAASNDTLPGWPASNAADNNVATDYSSNIFPSASNTRGTYLAGWFASQQSFTDIILTARMSGGVPLAFPQSYQVYVTTPDGSTWNLLGNFTAQPDGRGRVDLALGRTYQALGVLVVPITLGKDNAGNFFFQLAELQVANLPVTSFYQPASAYSNDALSGWPASNAIDGDPGTVYSSGIFSGSANDRGTFLAAWLSGGPQSVTEAVLTARMVNGAPTGFPVGFDVYVTSPDNSSWVFVGNYSALSADSSGNYVVSLGRPYQTQGILLVPTTIGTDPNGSHFFQLAEVKLGG